MKKSLLFGLLAVLAAVFIFTACDNGTTSTEKGDPYPVETPIEVDVIAANNGALKTLLEDQDYLDKVIGIETNITLDNATLPTGGTIATIPVGYTVYLIGANTLSTDTGYGLKVAGKLLVGPGATLTVPEDDDSIVVADGGSIVVEPLGNITLYKATDINDGAKKPATVLGDTSKVKVTGGTLTVDAFTKLADLTKAFDSVESGDLIVTNLVPVKPSDITSLPITKDRKLTVGVSKPDLTATSLHIPEGLALRAHGSLPLLTELDIDGEFEVIGNLPELADLTINGTFNSSGKFAKLETLTIEGESELSGDLSALKTLVVNGTLDTTDATLPTALTAGVEVTVGVDGVLILDEVVLNDSTIIGELELVGDVIVATTKVLTIDDPKNVSGTGAAIIAEGGTTGGVISAGFIYTTKPTGIEGDTFNDAVKAIDKDFITLTTDRVSGGLLTGTFGPKVEETSIGSATVVSDSATVAVSKTNNGVAGTAFTLADANSDLVQSGITGATFDKEIAGLSGPGPAGSGDITSHGTFDVEVDTGTVKVGDSDFNNTTPKAVIITFKNLLPSNSGLIGPEEYLVSFSVGIITGRP
jgi:hypothetical protein